jgi:hypothetical protein
MSIENCSPDAAYLTKNNIVHPGSAAQVTAAEAKARADIAERRNGVAVTGGSIKRG